jgi:hydrogenase 3 maturation protease
MFEELQERIAEKNVLILGVGNRQRGDDGVGSYLVKRLQKKVHIPMIDAGDVPENFISRIESSGANLVIVVDAVDFGAHPGEAALIELRDLKKMGASTRSANLPLLFNVIPKSKRPESVLVAVQPATSTGSGLSDRVREALDGLESIFVRLFRK